MGEVSTAIEGFFTDLQDLLQVIAPIFAFLGVVGLGIMYMGSSFLLLAIGSVTNPKPHPAL